MQTKFKKRLDVQINHQYYVNSRTADLQFFPTARTQKMLNGNRMRFQPTNEGFCILSEYRVEGNTQSLIIAPDQPMEFTFMVLLSNTAFINFTSMDAPTAPNSIYTFERDSDSAETMLINEQVELYGQQIPVTFSHTTTTAKVQLLDIEGNTVIEEIIDYKTEDPAGTYNYDYQLVTNQLRPDRYILKVLTGAGYTNVLSVKAVHVDSELVKNKAFGLVTIRETFAELQASETATRPYSIEFYRRRVSLQYSVRFSEDPSGFDYYIEANGVDNPLGYTGPMPKLVGVIDPGNDKLMHFNADDTDTEVYFDFFETPYIGYELVRYAEGSTIDGIPIKSNLANPSPYAGSSRVLLTN